MSDFTCRFQSITGADIPVPEELEVVPIQFTRGRLGGCLHADIEVYGPIDLLWSMVYVLGRKAVIFSPDGQPVWWGIVEDVVINRGALSDGISIRDMINRARFNYIYEELGETVDGQTDWAENAESIAKFGFVKEHNGSIETEMQPGAADQYRDNFLLRRGLPTSITGQSTGETFAQIRGSGLINTLQWMYYDQPLGLATHEAEQPTEQALGAGLTSSRIGHAVNGKISELDGKFAKLRPGWATITGTGNSNNRDTEITSVDSREVVDFDATQMAFEANDDWVDSDDALSFLEVDDYAEVTGTANNNGIWRVRRSGADHVVVRGAGPVVGELPSGGNIRRGTYIQVDSILNNEAPGATVTIVLHGQQITQAFQITSATGWTVAEIKLRLARVGMPGDSLQLDICADSGGQPGTVLETSIISPALLAEETLNVETFAFSNTTLLSPSTTYHLRLKRTGSNSHEAFYLVELDEKGSGALLWNGSAWYLRDPAAALAYRIEGTQETTAQIRQIAITCGQNFITRTDIRVASGKETLQWRDGEMLAYDELVALLNLGTSDGKVLIADVTLDRILRITAEKPLGSATVQETLTGVWVDMAGEPLPEGYLPVGEWVQRGDIPSGIATHYRMSPKFIEEMTYDCTQRKISNVRYRGEPEDSDFLGLNDG